MSELLHFIQDREAAFKRYVRAALLLLLLILFLSRVIFLLTYSPLI
jgi:hypothetical protein